MNIFINYLGHTAFSKAYLNNFCMDHYQMGFNVPDRSTMFRSSLQEQTEIKLNKMFITESEKGTEI